MAALGSTVKVSTRSSGGQIAALSAAPARRVRGANPRLVVRASARPDNKEGNSQWREDFEDARESRKAAYMARWQQALQAKFAASIQGRKPPPMPEAPPPPAKATARAAPPAAEETTVPVPAPSRKVEPAPIPQNRPPVPLSNTTRVTFNLKFATEFGQSLRVIGSSPELGAWEYKNAPALNWGSGNNWSVTLDLHRGGVVEYKYVVVDSTGSPTAWQSGNNSVLAVKPTQDELDVFDNWEGSPGSSVSADGQNVTRENQLLSWASEIETVMTGTRNELRQSRIELMSAKDEAKIARAESSQLKTELTQERAVTKRQAAEIKELKGTNRELQAQLVESKTGFQKAFETASQLLSQLDEEDEDGNNYVVAGSSHEDKGQRKN